MPLKMIAFDTNILARYLVADDPEQFETARAVMMKAVAAEETVFIGQIVLCELVWVLSSRYKHPKADIISELRKLLRATNIEVEDINSVTQALNAYETGRGDFADYLIAERATAAGCERVLTFEKDLWSDPRFVAPEQWAR